MGWQSKATLAWLNNFSKPINPQKPTVEEVFHDENTHFEDEDKDKDFLEHGFFFLDEEQPPGEDLDDSDSDEEVDEEELNELKNEADIKHFNAVLAQAQAMAVKAEHEAAGEKPKCKLLSPWIWTCHWLSYHRSVMLIVLPGLSAPMVRVWAVRRWPRQTENIMAIGHCLQRWLQS